MKNCEDNQINLSARLHIYFAFIVLGEAAVSPLNLHHGPSIYEQQKLHKTIKRRL